MSDILSQTDLRRRAVIQLAGANAHQDPRLSASAAFRVLHDLASVPSTAAAAMALLHELQVHQVEVEIQDEELRRSRAELEANLMRQVQLYDCAPVGCFTVDANTALLELNLTAARMLGSERGLLLGRPLDSFLAPRSAHAVRSLLDRVKAEGGTPADSLHVLDAFGAERSVHASACRDPGGEHFLIAFVDVVGRG